MTGELKLSKSPHHNSEALVYLESADPKLRPYLSIDALQRPKRKRSAYEELARLIISQQLSGSAANTIFGRIQQLPHLNKRVSPNSMLKNGSTQLQGCGVSKNKAEYVFLLAELLEADPRYFQKLGRLNDSELLVALTDLRGIGEWTATLFMMTYYQRGDVFPFGDVSLKKAVGLIYGSEHVETPTRFEAVTQKWSPYRSSAARILWRALDSKLIV